MFTKRFPKSGLVVMALMYCGSGGNSHVMGDHQASRPDERQEFIQVIEVTLFVGVNEDQINGSFQLCHFLMSIT